MKKYMKKLTCGSSGRIVYVKCLLHHENSDVLYKCLSLVLKYHWSLLTQVCDQLKIHSFAVFQKLNFHRALNRNFKNVFHLIKQIHLKLKNPNQRFAIYKVDKVINSPWLKYVRIRLRAQNLHRTHSELSYRFTLNVTAVHPCAQILSFISERDGTPMPCPASLVFPTPAGFARSDSLGRTCDIAPALIPVIKPPSTLARDVRWMWLPPWRREQEMAASPNREARGAFPAPSAGIKGDTPLPPSWTPSTCPWIIAET